MTVTLTRKSIYQDKESTYNFYFDDYAGASDKFEALLIEQARFSIFVESANTIKLTSDEGVHKVISVNSLNPRP